MPQYQPRTRNKTQKTVLGKNDDVMEAATEILISFFDAMIDTGMENLS